MSNGPSDETIAAYAADLIDIEGRIEQLQGDKKDTYGSVREAFGKRTADSLKLAIKRHRMAADKRDAADDIDAEAERMLGIINAPRAPRATRSASPVPEHDADGVIIEQAETPNEKPVAYGRKRPANTDGTARSLKGHDQPEGAAANSASMSEVAVVRVPAGSQPISEPAEVPPTPASTMADDGGAGSPAAASVVTDNVVPIKKRWTFNDKPHADCLNPGQCGGFSNIKVCQRCREAADGGQVA